MAGCGTVGAGVARLLVERRAELARRFWFDLHLVRVLVRDARRDRGDAVPAETLTRDASLLLSNDVDLVIEVIGGCDVAREIVLSAIRAGKPVVTANKALIALHGQEVFEAAFRAGVPLGIEASCCGGIPVVSAIERGLAANRIDALYGIVNGTCNYILTEMLDRRRSYEEALRDAQRLGYAEADPTLDIDGTDSAHKLAILASLAFGAPIAFERVAVEGIARLELADLTAGLDQGYICKLLAMARRYGEGLVLRVSPAFLETSHPLAHVRGPFNAVSIYGDAVGHTLFYGRGAGAGPTASAVLADVIEIARGGARPVFPGTYGQTAGGAGLPDKPADDMRSRFYVRFLVRDQPGVMADITRIFADHRVSLSAITQQDPHDETCRESVTAVVITHRAREGDFRAALAQSGRLGSVTRPPVAIRIVDEHEEA